VLLKNVTVDDMIIVTFIVGVKCAPECTIMQQFEGENTIFSGDGHDPFPDLTLTGEGGTHSQALTVGAFGASIRALLAIEPPLAQTTFLALRASVVFCGGAASFCKLCRFVQVFLQHFILHCGRL